MLGYSLLLSDVDILALKNPFDHLHRDEDVEALSDGFDPPTAYGERAGPRRAGAGAAGGGAQRIRWPAAAHHAPRLLRARTLHTTHTTHHTHTPTPAGYDDVFDDPKMGWSRWAHTIRVFTLNSGLFYIRPNTRTIALMDRITARLMKEKAWDQAVRCPQA